MDRYCKKPLAASTFRQGSCRERWEHLEVQELLGETMIPTLCRHICHAIYTLSTTSWCMYSSSGHRGLGEVWTQVSRDVGLDGWISKLQLMGKHHRWQNIDATYFTMFQRNSLSIPKTYPGNDLMEKGHRHLHVLYIYTHYILIYTPVN